MLAAVATALASDDVAGLATLTRTATSLAVREACYKALDSFAKTHKNNELVSDDVMRTAFAALVEAINEAPPSRSVLLAGLRALGSWQLVGNPHARMVAGAAGAVRAVVTAMCTKLADADLQETGCILLADLFFDTPQNVVLAEDAEAVTAVMAAAQGYPNSVNVQWAACRAIWYAIAYVDAVVPGGATANANAAVALGAVELVAAELISADEKLSAVACAVLANLIFLEEGRTRALRCDTFGSILQAMRVYTANVDVQRFGCLALGRMGGDEAGVAVATRLGAHAVIVRAMQLFPAHREMQGCACFALYNLLPTSPTQRDDAKHAGAVSCVVHALKTQADDAEAQQYACSVLTRLSALQPANTAEALRVGAFPVLISALETCFPCFDALVPCLTALCFLVESTVGTEELGGTPAADCNALLRAAVAAMRAHPDTWDIQLPGCGILRGMLSTQLQELQYADAVLKEGGFEAILAALQTFVGQPCLALRACHVLGTLASLSCNKRPHAVIAAAVDAVIAAMRAHASIAAVQRMTTYALWRLVADLPDVIEQARQCGAVDLLCEILRTHADDHSVELQAMSALYSLTCKAPACDATAAAAAGSILAEVLMRPSLFSNNLSAISACYAFANIASCAASNISIADAVALLLDMVNRSAHDLDTSVASCSAFLIVIRISPQHAAEAARRGAVAAVQGAARLYPGSEKLQSTASTISVLLARAKKSASQGTTAAATTPQAREEAERRAEAMAAALIAEEESARAAQAPARSNKSGKKKRAGAGAGSAGSSHAVPSGAALPAAAQAASTLEKLTLDDEANDYSAPSAAAMRRRRRAAAKAARRRTAGAAEASGGEDDEAKGADAAFTAAVAPSTAASSADLADAAATSLTAALRSPTPALPTPPVLPTAPSQHGVSAAVLSPQVSSLKECCVCFIDVPAAELVALVPCGHRCMCEACWRERLLPREPATRLCPICHAPAAAAMRVFDI